jgi:hypothetical protein
MQQILRDDEFVEPIREYAQVFWENHTEATTLPAAFVGGLWNPCFA